MGSEEDRAGDQFKKLSIVDQAKFEAAQRKEWNNIYVEKKAVRVLSVAESKRTRESKNPRIVDGRFVNTWKIEDLEVG